MSLLQWPFKRISYDGKTNPRFVSDIQAANEGLMDAIIAVTGFSGDGFAIISGFSYITGVPNMFTPGIFYLNGVIYVYPGSDNFNEGEYLVPNPVGTLETLFQDETTNDIYTLYEAELSADFESSVSTPQFMGNMNKYRIGLQYFQACIAALQATAATLGGAAFLNVGTITGTVAAGDDARLVYNQSEFNTLFAGKAPTQQGLVQKVFDIAGNFLTFFDGTGLGITAPWIGWAIFNGNNGLPDATGAGFVGVGTGFVSKTPGGANSYQILDTDLPVLQSDDVFLATSGTGTSGVDLASPGSSLGRININVGSPNNAISLLSKYIPVYFVCQVAT